MRSSFEKLFQEQLLLEQQTRNIPLFAAMNQRDLSKIQQLLQKGANVNVRAPGGGKTPLHLAVEMGDEKIVEVLIQAKADVNAATEKKHTPLHVAAQGDYANLINRLIQAGAKRDAITGVGCTPLHEAAAAACRAAVKMLLELKADPTIRDSRLNLTAAHLAHEKGYPEIRDIIVQAMTYAPQFNHHIQFMISDWKKIAFSKPITVLFLKDLEKAIKDTEDADTLFLTVRTVFKSPTYAFAKKELAPIRAQCITYMQRYNTEKAKALIPFASNPEVQGVTTALREIGLWAQENNRDRPINIILEYCDLPTP